MAEHSSADSSALRIRRAQEEDLMLYFSWANDPEVRHNSFNQEPISLEKHEHWFRSKLTNPNAFLYVLESDGKPVGQIRFDIGGEDNALVAEIGFSLDSGYRGKGLGTALLLKGMEQFSLDAPKPILVQGTVKPNNVASNKAFVTAGFIEQVQSNREQLVRYYHKQLV
jgi:RimJ/RimL family protein N-acetyltransferase